MPFTQTPDGTRLYYETIGQGEPLLFISGQGSDHHGWDEVRDDFAAHYQVIVYDHRGTGQSDKPESPPYTTRGFARDAIAVLDALHIERAHIYGISMGGRIGQWLAIDFPERVGAVVLGCTTPGNKHGVVRPAEVDEWMKSRDQDAIAQTLVSPGWMAQHPEWVQKRAEQALNPIPAHAQRLHYAASEGHDSWAELPRLSAPTLVIHGSEDMLNMTANAYLLQERILNAELYIVNGGRHIYFVEYQAESSAAVLEFLARHPLNTL